MNYFKKLNKKIDKFIKNCEKSTDEHDGYAPLFALTVVFIFTIIVILFFIHLIIKFIATEIGEE